MSISMSEPDAGSDLRAVRTLAVREGEHYVINGQKLWSTGTGARHDVINLYCKTDPRAHYRCMSLFLVENDRPGVELRKLNMLGRHCTGTYEIFFRDVRVPADHLIGGENNGWDCVLAGLQTNAPLRRPAMLARAWEFSISRLPTRNSAISSVARSGRFRPSVTCWPTWPPRSRPPVH
jgi:alkylation response protein AidB-like acyl-CoA dehydrogenase